MNDFIETKKLQVEVQANGIIRNAQSGYLIGRLVDDVNYDSPHLTAPYNWMEEARGAAAQCWCDKETEKKEMDVVLAEAVAKRIAAWMETAAQNQRNTDYYRGLLVECGRFIGERAFTADDGTIMDDVLCAKLPEIIQDDYA